MSEKEPNPGLNSLINQLKDTTLVNKYVQKQQSEDNVTPENIEEFVVKNSSELINQSLSVMRDVKDYIAASSDPDSISALADLIKASSSAIESLNKIVIQNKRSATTLVSKKMDVDAKQTIEDTKTSNAFIGTRKEIFDKLLKDAKVVDVEETDVDSSNPDQSNQPSQP
jgi:hypothetical protein